MDFNKIYINLFLIYLILFYLVSCIRVDPNISYEELETKIRSIHDKRAVFTYNQYEKLLHELSKDKYIVLPINEFRNYKDSTKVIIGLRHDVDCHPFKALEIGLLENKYKMRSTFYFLSTAEYSGAIYDDTIIRYKCLEKIYIQLYKMGHEIGIHNDLLTVLVKYKKDPLVFNKNEILYYKNIGIPIYGSVAHGCQYIPASTNTANYEIFSDLTKKREIEYEGTKYKIGQHSLSEFGFQYEANFVNHNKYFSESGGKWRNIKDFNNLLFELQNSKPGDRIQILTHPVWWGKK